MTLGLVCRGRCQDRVERTGKWEKLEMSFLQGSVQYLWCVLRNDDEQFLSHVCVRSLLGHKNTLAWSAAEASRMQCGEAVVPVSWLVEQAVLVLLLRTDKKVGHSGKQDASFSEEGRHTFFEFFWHCVVLSIVYCFRIEPITMPRHA